MKRIITLLVSLAMTLGLLAGTALAGGHEWEHEDPHGHVMLIGVQVDGDGFASYKRCVELANGEALPTPAHHHSVHTGNAGGSPMVQGPLFRAGNWIVPLFPFHEVPFRGCGDIPNPLPPLG